ncbi:sugar ABC transporter substrate-binding protein [Pendulispora albinea]|uniref:Sugar ABC transporter substrate-binding protein n=1 Tax=Pendulispora albinea TaxID=2741071 RepID=A0ABZ2M4Z0_9BACT
MKTIVSRTSLARLVGSALVIAPALLACNKDQGSSASTNSSAAATAPAPAKPEADTIKIGLLLPETKTARYEAADRPFFVARLKEICPKCEVLYQNADQKTDKQQAQAESLLINGIKVLVIDPVDAKAVAGVIAKAKAQNVAVLAYERLAQGPADYHVSFDNEQVGRLQAQALLDALKKGGDPKRGKIVMINGSPTDPNAGSYKKGAHAVLDGQVNIGMEYDTPDWSPDKAQDEMQQAITAIGKKNIIGVYCANDGTASGAIAAMKGAGFADLPPVTGQDAELAAVQRIVAGQQYMTVYKAIKKEAIVAADMAYAMAQGKPYTEQKTVMINNGTKDIPSVLLAADVVTKENVKDTVIKDGFHAAPKVCEGTFAAACKTAGIL